MLQWDYNHSSSGHAPVGLGSSTGALAPSYRKAPRATHSITNPLLNHGIGRPAMIMLEKEIPEANDPCSTPHWKHRHSRGFSKWTKKASVWAGLSSIWSRYGALVRGYCWIITFIGPFFLKEASKTTGGWYILDVAEFPFLFLVFRLFFYISDTKYIVLRSVHKRT